MKNNVKEYYKILQFYLKEKIVYGKVEHMSIAHSSVIDNQRNKIKIKLGLGLELKL